MMGCFAFASGEVIMIMIVMVMTDLFHWKTRHGLNFFFALCLSLLTGSCAYIVECGLLLGKSKAFGRLALIKKEIPTTHLQFSFFNDKKPYFSPTVYSGQLN